MAKLIDQIDSSGLFAQSAYSAAVATNDDLGRKISTTYLTAVDLSPYATTATTNTLSGQIEELSGTISAQMSLSAGEGINFVEDAENHRTRIDLGLSAGSNMTFVYDQETNTIRLDAEGGTGGIDWTTGTDLSAIVQTSSNSERGFINMFGMFPSGYRGLIVSSHNMPGGNKWTVTNDSYFSTKHFEGSDTNYYFANSYLGNYGITVSAGSHDSTRKESDTYVFNNLGLSYNNTVSATWGPTTSNTTTWTWNDIKYIQNNSASLGKTYTGVSPIQVNNTTNEISITGESLSAGPGINLFESSGYVVISAEGGNAFPITGTNGTTGFTANMDCSSMMLTTGASPAGGYVKLTTRGVQYEAYPAVDVSASWYNIITQYNNTTCSSVKLTTAASENRFYTSALPNLNKITFIAPTYGPYETYSALIDDGETTFKTEVNSGCCVTVVRCWNDDRHKDCWCGLNQETYFYIG